MVLVNNGLSFVGGEDRDDSTGVHEITSLLTDRGVLEEFGR
jgi:hypothetical protein